MRHLVPLMLCFDTLTQRIHMGQETRGYSMKILKINGFYYNPIVKTQKPSVNSWYNFVKSVYIWIRKCNIVNFDYFWVLKLKIAMLLLFTKIISFYEFKHVYWNEFCDIVSSKSMHFSTEFQALLQKIHSLNFVSVDPTLFLKQLYLLNLLFPTHIFD